MAIRLIFATGERSGLSIHALTEMPTIYFPQNDRGIHQSQISRGRKSPIAQEPNRAAVSILGTATINDALNM
ncbi:hypothetical protein D4R75_05540 [bacterium]|nr:MAG: hypothetical protein D4R75_05540 [bacterium]